MRSAGETFTDLSAEMIEDRKEAPVRRRCQEVDRPGPRQENWFFGENPLSIPSSPGKNIRIIVSDRSR
jgi:hypothetical protein